MAAITRLTRPGQEEDNGFRLPALGIIAYLENSVTPSIKGVLGRTGTDRAVYIGDEESYFGEEKSSVKRELVNYNYTKTGEAGLDYFVSAMTEGIVLFDLLDPHLPGPLKQLDDKVNAFLQKHIGADYSAVTAGIDFDTFSDEDFNSLPQAKLRRKLFDYRAKLYLSALAAAEEHGFNAPELARAVEQYKIFPIKREVDEPVFSYLKGKLFP